MEYLKSILTKMESWLKIVVLIFIMFTYSFDVSALPVSSHNKAHKHNNHLALLVGNTSQKKYSSNKLTFGMDYTYFFQNSEHWGISAFGEMILGQQTEWLLGLPVVYKLNNFWLRSGPGIELAKDQGNKIDYYFLLRFGGGYDFHFKKFTLTPTIDFDGIRKHPALVIGFNIGYGF